MRCVRLEGLRGLEGLEPGSAWTSLEMGETRMRVRMISDRDNEVEALQERQHEIKGLAQHLVSATKLR